MENIQKSIEDRFNEDKDRIEKAVVHKYFKREGTPGHYKYYYTEEEYNAIKKRDRGEELTDDERRQVRLSAEREDRSERHGDSVREGKEKAKEAKKSQGTHISDMNKEEKLILAKELNIKDAESLSSKELNEKLIGANIDRELAKFRTAKQNP